MPAWFSGFSREVWTQGLLPTVALWLLAMSAGAAEPLPGDALVDRYFAAETARLREGSLAEVRTIDDWKSHRDEYRRQLLEMLGLDPMPAKTDLQTQVTGRVEHAEFTVENLHFQSRPGLYVTGNLYVPRERAAPLPAILYVCGHAKVVKDGVSYGGKAHYQHHGAWLARNGYVCLVIDTLQLGEIEGIHHGTYNQNRWWWLSRGYTPAGVEAWNCIRALDYLQSRPEVDPAKLGVTGRSGGGAYSWWISAIDDRIQAAVPVAGITDLQNYVVDGCVEGHCDCMFMVNTYRWDYPQVAALNSPRPLLVSNTNRDRIFPLDGVYRTYSAVQRVYALDGHEADVGFNITSGGHVDTQELQVHAIHWFDQHLKKEQRLIRNVAEPLFEPAQLKVFQELPSDQLNTRIDETFVPRASAPPVPNNWATWEQQREAWRKALLEKTFRGWPIAVAEIAPQKVASWTKDGIELTQYEFISQEHVPLALYCLKREGLAEPQLMVLNPLDEAGWTKFRASLATPFASAFPQAEGNAEAATDYADLQSMLKAQPWVMAYVAPRGVGPTQWDREPRHHTQILRRFYLLGQTWEGMQVWDIRRALQACRAVQGDWATPLWLQAEGSMAVLTAYAALFEPPVKRLDLHRLPQSHEPEGPALLNVLKTLDVPQVLALAAEKSQIVVYDSGDVTSFAAATGRTLQWPDKQVQARTLPKGEK